MDVIQEKLVNSLDYLEFMVQEGFYWDKNTFFFNFDAYKSGAKQSQ